MRAKRVVTLANGGIYYTKKHGILAIWQRILVFIGFAIAAGLVTAMAAGAAFIVITS